THCKHVHIAQDELNIVLEISLVSKNSILNLLLTEDLLLCSQNYGNLLTLPIYHFYGRPSRFLLLPNLCLLIYQVPLLLSKIEPFVQPVYKTHHDLQLISKGNEGELYKRRIRGT